MLCYKQFLWLREAVSEFIPTYLNAWLDTSALNPESAIRLTVPLCLPLLESLLALISLNGEYILRVVLEFILVMLNILTQFIMVVNPFCNFFCIFYKIGVPAF